MVLFETLQLTFGFQLHQLVILLHFTAGALDHIFGPAEIHKM
jgi:hypothetical protein